MFDHLKEYSIYIKPGFTDMRKRADSLSLLVRSEMGMDPMEKSIYIFCGRDRKRVTAIVLKTTEFNQNRPLILTKRNITDFNQNMAECSRNTIISLSLAI